jgi:hypothetical protein
VAARVVEAYPRSTWRGVAGELIEDEDPKKITQFEKAWSELSLRLKIWSTMMKVDILSGLGHYAILYLGAPGSPTSPLPTSVAPENLMFLSCYAEDEAKIKTLETKDNERFGQALTYAVKRLTNAPGAAGGAAAQEIEVHWSRVIHIADGLLDDQINGQPRLERVWNLLDDLEKVTGAGAEAFWLRAHQGYQFNLDKDTKLDSQGEEELEEEVDAFLNGVSRAVRTRGLDLKVLGSDVATFDRNVDSIISQISSGTGIPQRILMGSERGQLASQQDRVNWAERIQDRRTEYAGPLMIRPLVDRLIEHGILPTPKQYEVRWPQIYDLSDGERADIAMKWAGVNQKNGGDKDSTKVVIVPNEIRDRVLGLPPINEADLAKMEETEKANLDIKKTQAEAKPFGAQPPAGPKPVPKAAGQ